MGGGRTTYKYFVVSFLLLNFAYENFIGNSIREIIVAFPMRCIYSNG